MSDGLSNGIDKAQKAVVGATVAAVVVGLAAVAPEVVKEEFGLKQNSYSNNNEINYVIKADGPVSVEDISANMLRMSGLPHDKDDVAAHMAASNIEEGTVALPGQEVHLAMPDDVVFDGGIDGWVHHKLSPYGEFEKDGQEYTDHTVMSIPFDEYNGVTSTRG